MRPRTSGDTSKPFLLTASLMAAVGLVWAGTAEAASKGAGPFRAACVKVDITPDTPQWLQGYGPRQSTGVHAHIYHRIAALDDGSTTFYLVSTDICTILPSFYRRFCERLEREAQIRPENIWWSTTHTHSAPHVGPQDLGKLFAGTLGDRFSIQHDTDYWAAVADKLVSGIKEAQSRLEPARLGIVSSTAAANVNRRQRRADGRIVLGVNPDGPVDRQLGVLRLERPDGTLIGLIANYAIHGTALGGGNRLISGDVPGCATQFVERSSGVPLLFINGAEGNVAPLHSVGSNIEDPRLKEYDTLLGERILAASAAIRYTTADVRLGVGKTVVETPRKSGLGWPEALANYSSTSADGTFQVRVPVYSLTINRDTVIWAAPLELFSEISLSIREASPFANTFYFGLTNGSLLYLPTKAAFAEGGYEPSVSPFTDRAEADFASAVSQYLRQLKAENGEAEYTAEIRDIQAQPPASPTDPTGPMWEMAKLSQSPRTWPAEGFSGSAPGAKAVFFQGLPYQGRETRVFAWIGLPDVPAGTTVPGVVLIHGGGGTAFDSWVRRWTSRGYAAIAMDTCGCVPKGSYGHWERHPAGGPPGWGGWDQIDQPREDQWTYHAVADAILAHSLLRSLPEVDASRTGLTGISWGGYLTCLVAGVDPRFKFAVPVYGCGFTNEHTFAASVNALGPERSARWMRWWDPSVYLADAAMPTCWVTGSNDFAYTFNALQKSYRLPKGPRTLCVRLRMPHGHGDAGEGPKEIFAFADSVVKGGAPLPRLTGQGRDANQVWATFESAGKIAKAELNVTRDTGRWPDRKWEALPVQVDAGRVTATLPEGTTVYYLNLFDDRDCVVSTEHEELVKDTR